MSDVDPDAVAAAAVSCPSVAGMSGGKSAEVATYLPGRRVRGVRITECEIELRVIARWGPFLPGIAEEVRSAVQPFVGGARVSVYIDDIQEPAGGDLPNGSG